MDALSSRLNRCLPVINVPPAPRPASADIFLQAPHQDRPELLRQRRRRHLSPGFGCRSADATRAQASARLLLLEEKTNGASVGRCQPDPCRQTWERLPRWRVRLARSWSSSQNASGLDHLHSQGFSMSSLDLPSFPPPKVSVAPLSWESWDLGDSSPRMRRARAPPAAAAETSRSRVSGEIGY